MQTSSDLTSTNGEGEMNHLNNMRGTVPVCVVKLLYVCMFACMFVCIYV